ncbi:MAG: transposase, partial [Pseudomonadota bacterium]
MEKAAANNFAPDGTAGIECSWRAPKKPLAQSTITSVSVGQTPSLHPHVHCVVPAGGLSFDHTRWVKSHKAFFRPVKVLGRVPRGKFIAGLQRAF